ncbi:hypothetical protein D6C84_03663 [Aureobasidium pullulans]|uniref:Uncharacterized protein n=1 Tax=Aureobasidium pullulans TaxID=5580 RepID=A0A4S9Y2D9_AURPU|nr:hypothetical protein D6C84_03663 [Aureobasidium pullulans]
MADLPGHLAMPPAPPALRHLSSGSRTHSRLFTRRTEPTRGREVFRYLRPWIDSFQDTVIPHVDLATLNERSPAGCNDTALAAFAQLGALRLNAQREYENAITSIRRFACKHDGLVLGTAAFSREDAITHLASNDWRRASSAREPPPSNAHYYTEGQSAHWLIVSDMSTQSRFLDLPLVQGINDDPLRFMCAVPIRSKLGSLVGSYCIIDTKPRYGVSADDMTFLEDMASTITNHLEAIVSTARQERAEKLIQGIGLFNTGKDTLRHWWIANNDEKNNRARGSVDDTGPNRSAQSERVNHDLGPEVSVETHERHTVRSSRAANASPDTTQDAASKDLPKSTSVKDFGAADRGPPAYDNSSKQEDISKASHEDQPPGMSPNTESRDSQTFPEEYENKTFNLQSEVKQAYSRASNLIRGSLGAEGVLFLDASMSHVSEPRPKATSGEVEGSAFASVSTNNTSDTTDTDSPEFSKSPSCSVMGFSTRAKSSLKGFVPSKNHLGLSRSFQKRLMRRYPDGTVFNCSESGSVYPSSGEEGSSGGDASATGSSETVRKGKITLSRSAKDGEALSGISNGASSIVFLPLWNVSSQRFRATALVWVATPLRHFDMSEDVTYLRAFSNSIMAEVARLETIAADNAKTTFISSVSHELRSPLHGVLGGVEFLEGTNLDTFQRDMTGAVKMAGMTLLDTVDNILEFVKLDHSSQSQGRRQRIALDQDSCSTGNNEVLMDLGKVTEDVVESVVIERRFEVMASNIQRSFESGTEEENLPEPVSVFLTMPSRDHWWIKSSPGSWTRILTNLLGNALKYTKTGSVQITIDIEDAIQTTAEAEYRPLVLTVQDSGIGMTSDFIKSGLFAPFQQEDTNSKGTGLGMSIVKSIVANIDGKIRVSSEVKKGTRIRFSHVAKFLTEPPSSDVTDDYVALALGAIHQDQLCLLTSKDEADEHAFGSREAVLRILHRSLGLEPFKVHFKESESLGNFNMTVDRDLFHEAEHDRKALKALCQKVIHPQRLIVLGSSIYEDTSHRAKQATETSTIYINQPIGPRKIARAIVQSMQYSRTPLDMSNRGPNPLYGVYSRQGSVSTPSEGSQTRASTLALHPPQPSSESYFPTTEGSPQRKQPQKQKPKQSETKMSKPEKVGSPEESSAKETTKQLPLVEDNEIYMRLLVALVKKLKLSYQCAENGLVAVEKYTADPSSFHLILMDMSMPVMDGFRATELIRQHEKKNSNLKHCMIAAITGVTSEQARKDAFSSGVDKFMAKPISMKQIRALIEDI